jgi:hypothetical protein
MNGQPEFPSFSYQSPSSGLIGPYLTPSSDFHGYSEYYLIINRILPDPGSPRVYILVEYFLFQQVSSYLFRYMNDLVLDGYYPVLCVGVWSNEVEVKDLLMKGHAQNLVGALLVGDIPIAWYEMKNSKNVWKEFPIELYYMDLDGLWLDKDGDGLYDGHRKGTGNLKPEIWVGRLYTSTLHIGGENEVSLIKNYFDKNHRYRTGTLPLNKRALIYIDDDWVDGRHKKDKAVGLLYQDRKLVWKKGVTTADDYKSRLDDNYEWVAISAHSNPYLHMFKRPNKPNTKVYSWDIDQIDPKANFYHLNACSVGDYSRDYIAGHYVFAESYGLIAMASTKDGSLQGAIDFYRPLSNGDTIGDAFLIWHCKNAETFYGKYSRSWFYGLTIIGDPTLVPNIA